MSQPQSRGTRTRETRTHRRRLLRYVCCFALVSVAAHAVEGSHTWVDAVRDWLEGSIDEKITVNHVFRATSDLIGEIHILREDLGADEFSPEAELQGDRALVHVYAKTLEVMSKVSRVQRRLGMDAVEVGQIPINDVGPRDVLASVSRVLAEVRRIKARMVIEREIEPLRYEGAKTPAAVYKNLADASFLLDGLAGRPWMPNETDNM